MGGAVEEVDRGVWGTTAPGAEVIRAPADLLPVGYEGRAEARPELGQG